MNNLLKFMIRPVYRRYKDLEFRIADLETAVDCLIKSPRWEPGDDIGFNAQKHRKTIFRELLDACNFKAIIETGTWTGNTAGYMATVAGIPVYTCEINERFCSIARMRLQDIPGISIELMDSRTFLKKMASTGIASHKIFIYLDAHWYDDLPLKEEIGLICSTWKDFVLMIDDFQVPGDQGYGYDIYGKKKTLCMDLFKSTFEQFRLTPFFPSEPSNNETGYRRGCVVLAPEGKYTDILEKLPSLKHHGKG